jgi:phage/plasmid primase-like uncharacterized protein
MHRVQMGGCKDDRSRWDVFKQLDICHKSNDTSCANCKAIDSPSVHVNGVLLVVPPRDADGALCSLQDITREMRKRFKPGVQITDCFRLIGDVSVDAPERIAPYRAVHNVTTLIVGKCGLCNGS